MSTATWSAPNYSQYVADPGLLEDLQPVSTWSVCGSKLDQQGARLCNLSLMNPGSICQCELSLQPAQGRTQN